jgi:hypothetical protein
MPDFGVHIPVITYVLVPEPGDTNFWRPHLTSYVESHGFDPTKVFAIQLHPRQDSGD